MLDLSASEGNVTVDLKLISLVKNHTPKFFSTLPSQEAYGRLSNLIASHYKVRDENVVLGNGSDEIIDNIIHLLGDGPPMALVPTFGRLVDVNTKYNKNSNPIILSLESSNKYLYTDVFHSSLIKQISDNKPSILWVCSPVNPTGTIVKISYLKELANAMKNGIVIIDEVYIDFLQDPEKSSAVSLVNQYDNVIVLNSFSKSWGLASFRVGFALTSPRLAINLNSLKLMYNLNALGVETATLCLNNSEYRVNQFERIHLNRNTLLARLEKLNIYEIVSNSEINLMCLRLKNNGNLYESLLKNGVKTKNLDKWYGMVDERFTRMLVPVRDEEVNLVLSVAQKIAEK